jgi:hypothetical protein
MANKKITELTALTSAASDDVLAIVDVSGTAETKKITVANLTAGGGDDHFILAGGGYISTTNEMAVGWLSTGDSNVFNYITTVLIPIDCRVVKVITQSQNSGGSTDISIYKPTSYNQLVSSATALGTVNQAAHDTGVVYTSTFDTATYNFTAGDRMGITVDSTSNLLGLSLTVLLKKI